MTIKFFVPGIPAPGGSKRAALIPKRGGGFVTRPDGRPVIGVRDDCERNKAWRSVVALAARSEYHAAPIAEPLRVYFRFVMPRPKSHYRGGDRSKGVKVTAPVWPAKKPDALKLARSTEDALTGIIWVDDAQTVRLTSEKVYGEQPGCEVTVALME